MQSVQCECQKLLVAAAVFEEEKLPRSEAVEEGVVSALQALSDRVQQLNAHCCVMLVTDGLRDWQTSQTDRAEKPHTDITAVSIMWCHMLCDVCHMLGVSHVSEVSHVFKCMVSAVLHGVTPYVQKALSHQVEKQLLDMQMKVKEITLPLLNIDGQPYLSRVEDMLQELMVTLEEMVVTAKQALLFLLMKVCCLVVRVWWLAHSIGHFTQCLSRP